LARTFYKEFEDYACERKGLWVNRLELVLFP